MFEFREKAGDAARKAGAVALGTVFALVGVGFFTAAGWAVLSELRSPAFAASVIGLIYFGMAAVVLAFGMSRRRKVDVSSSRAADVDEVHVEAKTPTQLVVLSFLQGLEQGRNARRAA